MNCLDGGEFKNGGISAYSTIQSSIGKYNTISQTSSKLRMSLTTVDWDRDAYT